jgi:hypothetical protein
VPKRLIWRDYFESLADLICIEQAPDIMPNSHLPANSCGHCDRGAFSVQTHIKRAARPWLPHDEKPLERIYWTAIEIAVRLSTAAD